MVLVDGAEEGKGKAAGTEDASNAPKACRYCTVGSASHCLSYPQNGCEFLLCFHVSINLTDKFRSEQSIAYHSNLSCGTKLRFFKSDRIAACHLHRILQRSTNTGHLSLSIPLSIPCREFEANVIILHHSTTICCGYQPVVHCGVLRQSAEMIEIKGRENLKTGESE